LLETEILELICEKREGAYWDFKQEYHENKAKLLHDIICLANNLENRNAYLIFGISDSGEVIGVEQDAKRKNQEHMVSFMQGKKFAGENTPYITLKTMIIEAHEIDVLIIKHTDKVPFYLAEPFRDGRTTVGAGNINIRVEDRNTPIDKTASPQHTEELWKRRFGLTPFPLQRLNKMLIQKKHWKTNENGYYFEESPEFTIVTNDEHEYSRLKGVPFYAYNQTNSKIIYNYYECRYHGTTLYETQTIALDAGRYHTPVPEKGFIRYDNAHGPLLDYRYFVKGTTKYYLHEFMVDSDSDEARTALRKFLKVVLVFESDEEREQFESHIKNNFSDILKRLESAVKERENSYIHQNDVRSLKIGEILVKELNQFSE